MSASRSGERIPFLKIERVLDFTDLTRSAALRRSYPQWWHSSTFILVEDRVLRDEARHRSMCVGGARCRRTAVQYGLGSGSAGNTWSGGEEFTVHRWDRGAECWCSYLCMHCFGFEWRSQQVSSKWCNRQATAYYFKKVFRSGYYSREAKWIP